MNQICCLNPDCHNPTVPDTTKFCPNCGIPLVILKGIYRPVKTLGSGGFGKTYLAENIGKFNEKCVIKLFAPQTQSTYALRKATELFEEEARRLQLLNHPQIPNLQLYFEEDGYLYLIQDFIDGDNLLIELANGTTFDEQKVRKLLMEILPILQIVHNQKIIHRDIKPENIMRCRSDGKLFLIDFGASKQLQGTMSPGTMIGSFGYASLEQMEDREVYPASDLYSLAATCFHLMTRIHPWTLWKKQGYGWVENWRDYVKQPISKELGVILDKLLQLEYQNRYQSAAELLQVFKNQTSPNSGSFQNQSSPNSASSQNQSSQNSGSSQNQTYPNSGSSQNQTSQNSGSSQNQSSQNYRSSQNQSSQNSGSYQNQTYPNSGSSQNQSSQNSRNSGNLTRRNFLIYPSLFVGGVTVAFLGQELLKDPKNPTSGNSTSNNNQTSKNPTSENSTSSKNQTSENLQSFNFEVVKTDSQGKEVSRSNASANYFTEDLGNGVTLEMVKIPGGSFIMGSPESEKDRDDDEGPQRRVTVPSFFIGRL
ncbi:MAG: protein kinase [Sphaerospermopsis sp. SIO1G2]|nr:protein kinase [Sphaerospermopsis sp. SIO1G2]